MSEDFILAGKDMISHRNYQHFMCDHVCLLGTYLLKNLECKIIIPNRIDRERGIYFYNSILKDILKILGLEDRVIITEDVNLYNKNPIGTGAWTWSIEKQIFFNTIRNKLPMFYSGPKNIYIVRDWGNKKGEIGGHNKMIRGIINSTEVESFLKENNYFIVDLSDKTFSEKKSILQNAESVITQTSASCVNLFLCENVKKIILLTNDVFIMGKYFLPYVQHCENVKIHELPFKSHEKEKYTSNRGEELGIDNANFYVDLNILNRYI